jgi:hypothetical protein
MITASKLGRAVVVLVSHVVLLPAPRVLQTPLLISEDIVTRRLRKAGVHLPRALLIGCANVILSITAYFFFFPPVEDYTGVAQRVLTSVNQSAAAVFSGLQALLQQVGLHPTAVGGGPFVGSVSTSL